MRNPEDISLNMEGTEAPHLHADSIELAEKFMESGGFSEACWVLRNVLKQDSVHREAKALLARCSHLMGLSGAARDYGYRGRQARHEFDELPGSDGVFIGGTGRSGTSLLRRVLNSNPAIGSIAGETKCINDAWFRLAPHWFNALPAGERGRGVEQLKQLWRDRFFCYVHSHQASLKDNRLRGFCLWLEREALESELPRLTELMHAASLHEIETVWGGLYGALFAHRSRSLGKRLWVEKTPRNSYFAEYLYAAMPGMKLINVVRDGRDAALSMQNVSWGEKDLIKAVDWWGEELDQTMRVLDALPQSSVLTVCYEDLVTEPQRVMETIGAFLGVPAEYDLDIFASSVARWKSEMPTSVQEYAVERYGQLFERFGYETGSVAAEGPTHASTAGFEMRKRNDGTRYMADLVLPLASQLKCVLMSELAEETSPSFFLRHDVDDDIDAALQMALLEKEHGIRAAYFLLPPSPSQSSANYYGVIDDSGLRPGEAVVEQARQLVDWGHEVGLHNNFAELAVHLKCDVAELIREQVEFFRARGIELKGTAAHGSPFFHENGFISFEIFAEGVVKAGYERGRTISVDGVELKLHSLNLADFGFGYEAYSLPYEIGLSDASCVWGGKLARHAPRPELNELQGAEYLAAFREMVATATPEHGVNKLMVLVHPEHWVIR